MGLIGLCGRSGSGKGVFSEIAENQGFKVIDCDAVYKSLVSHPSPCLAELEAAFGKSIIKNNSLNRPVLAKIVFSNKEKLALLNKITHKHILAEIEAIIASYGEDADVILDAPTLFESGLNEKCGVIVGVVAPDEECISRIMQRDSISRENAVARLSNQKSNEFLGANCHIIINNNSTLDAFENSVKQALKSIKEGSHEA